MGNNEIISLLKKAIPEIVPEGKAFLYGSRARGDFRPDSDIDILILLPDTYEGKEFVLRQSEISAELYLLSLNNDIDISPVITVEKIFKQRETPFTLNIKREGIRL